ncbi:TolC family protein [Ulvibacterium sp.]|uniref:TolC family protein n=1 Tax=Ulvibacterium sp. TaxID=2665914 RepID=UPI00262CE2C8|nr:TolC family protein [Ulvibacterium sp.]
MKRQISKLVLLLLMFLPLILSAQELTLTTAKKLLLQNNGEYNASVIEVNRLREEKKVNEGLYYPSLSILGNYLHLQDDISVDLNNERDLLAGLLNVPDPNALGNWRRVLQGKDFAFASARFRWPLYTGGKINAANKASGIRLEIGAKQQDIKERDLMIELINSYYRTKLAQELLILRKEVLNTVTLHKDRADKFFENGMIPEVEILNAKVAYSNANREVVAAEKDYNLAKTALQNLIGNIAIENLSSTFHIPEELPTLEEFQEIMITQSLGLDVLEQNKVLAGVNIRAEKSAYLPSLAAMGSYRFYNESFAIGQTDWYVGLGLQWNLFDGFQREHKIKAAKEMKSQVEALKSQAELGLMTLTEKLYRSMEKQYELSQSLENDQKLAEELMFMRRRAFEEGTGTSLEVVDATLLLSQVRFQKIMNLYDYSVTKGELMVRMGQIDNFLN